MIVWYRCTGSAPLLFNEPVGNQKSHVPSIIFVTYRCCSCVWSPGFHGQPSTAGLAVGSQAVFIKRLFVPTHIRRFFRIRPMPTVLSPSTTSNGRALGILSALISRSSEFSSTVHIIIPRAISIFVRRLPVLVFHSPQRGQERTVMVPACAEFFHTR